MEGKPRGTAVGALGRQGGAWRAGQLRPRSSFHGLAAPMDPPDGPAPSAPPSARLRRGQGRLVRPGWVCECARRRARGGRELARLHPSPSQIPNVPLDFRAERFLVLLRHYDRRTSHRAPLSQPRRAGERQRLSAPGKSQAWPQGLPEEFLRPRQNGCRGGAPSFQGRRELRVRRKRPRRPETQGPERRW